MNEDGAELGNAQAGVEQEQDDGAGALGVGQGVIGGCFAGAGVGASAAAGIDQGAAIGLGEGDNGGAVGARGWDGVKEIGGAEAFGYSPGPEGGEGDVMIEYGFGAEGGEGGEPGGEVIGGDAGNEGIGAEVVDELFVGDEIIIDGVLGEAAGVRMEGVTFDSLREGDL